MLEVLELITVSAKLFNKERALYYINEASKLKNIIYAIEDSDFYNKDMNAKAKAERDLQDNIKNLRLEFISEAKSI